MRHNGLWKTRIFGSLDYRDVCTEVVELAGWAELWGQGCGNGQAFARSFV